MQRNKYLDDLGLRIDEYGTNFMKDNDPREIKWRTERELYGFDNRETWNLDSIFAEWLYSHLMMYRETCIVNLSFYKWTFQGKEYTQEEAINVICKLCKNYILDCDDKENIVGLQNATRLFADILPAMWW